jgi:glyoxylase-like metal-dependent hydrolase (beta-lactamase superfamily II)
MADEIPFVKELKFQYGELERVGPNVRRLIARNPSPFTYTGTGTYVVGQGRVAVIDPGPASPEHVTALLHALQGEAIAHIIITHTHLDHSPAAPLLVARTGAPTFGFGPHARGRHHAEDEVEAGADWAFVPDHILEDGDVLEGAGYALQALHTPGHCSNHLCLSLRDDKTLFTGDHVMGWSTSVIAPPDGDMGHYVAQLQRLLGRDDVRYLPTHGAPIEEPKPLVAALIRHRQLREQQILACLADGVFQIRDMVERMYVGVPRALHPAAARSVFAHLLHLLERGRVATSGQASLDAEFHPRDSTT